MIRLAVLVFVLIIIGTAGFGQSVQWADKVLGYSSQLTPIQYAATQALGKPSVLPAGGQNPGAWAPDKPNRSDFLKLGFANPIQVQQVAVAESHNPSALFRVLLYDEAGKEYEVYTLNPGAKPLKSRMLNIFFDKTPYQVTAVKLEFDGGAVPDFYGIDAVAISDSNYPVLAFVPTPDQLADDILVEALDENVNSEYSELNPLLSPDGKTLYFGRKNHPQNTGGVKDKEDIWYSQLGEDGKWLLPRNMGSQFNNDYPNFIGAISSVTPDGKAFMLLGNRYESNGKMTAGISISTYSDGKWSEPVPVDITNDYNLSDRANYFMSSSRKVILMAIQRRDTEGERDLYVSFLGENNVWSEPINLGKTVNTVADESAPFLMDDERTLYFSSKGHSGYGGADIYVTQRLDDSWKNWSEPKNMGNRINSSLDDVFFNIPQASEYAYYSRQVSEDNFNIYRARLPLFKEPDVWVTVKGRLLDAESGSGMGATIIAEKLSGGERIGTVQASAATGEYELKLKAGEVYSLRAEAPDHISESQRIDMQNIKSNQVLDNSDFILRNIRITPIAADAMIRLNNVYFDFDKAELKPDSFLELDRIVELLVERPTLKVGLAGHTDNIGSKAYNMALSKRRAQAVKNYLTRKGIQESRIEAAGYGATRPLVSNEDEKDGREINRRVEFKIISE